MKYINYIFRFLVGALFIFSGFIKSNDTKGFAIKLHEYFEVFAKDAQADQDTFSIHFKSVYHEGSYAIPLYEKETSKTYSIQTSLTGDRYDILPDTMEDLDENYVEMGEMAVNYLQATNSILRDSMYAPNDSAYAGSVTVTASIAGKVVHTKTHQLDLLPTEIMEAIDVKSYLKTSSWLVGFFEKMGGYATALAMFICLLEILLGIWLLLGIKPKLTVWLLLLLTLFFTFLTFYAAYYNKVTDCGCFGDFIKLKPWETFQKDVVLTIMILFLFFSYKYINPIFSSKFGTTLTIVLMGICTLFMAYSYLYLPVFDFLQYSEGSDLREKTSYPKGVLEQDIVERTYLYKNGEGKEFESKWSSKTNLFEPKPGPNDQFVKTMSEQVIEKAYVLPIHDFENITSPWGNDIADTLLQNKGFTLLVPSVYVDEVHKNAPAKINALYNAWQTTGNAFYALTSSGQPEIQAYREKYKTPYMYGSADNKLLLSMIRSNPGLILIKDGKVIKRWCFRSLPTAEKLLSYTK